MQVQSFGVSDRGRVRKTNEDCFLANQQELLFLVADGMGGLSKGGLASRIAIESIEKFVPIVIGKNKRKTRIIDINICLII